MRQWTAARLKSPVSAFFRYPCRPTLPRPAIATRPGAPICRARQQVANARVAHLLLYAGVRDVRLLDGGTHAWQAQDLPLTTAPAPVPVPTPTPAFGLHLPACPHLLIDTMPVPTAMSTT